MRCVMLSMVEAGAKKLNWSTTASIIKLGFRMLTDPSQEKAVFSAGRMAVSAEEAETVQLLMREMPIFNGIKLVE